MISFALPLLAAAASSPPSPFSAGYNGRAKTPPMGWRTWNAFHQYIDQAQNELVMEALAAKNRTVKGEPAPVSLLELGYQSFGIGAAAFLCCWQCRRRRCCLPLPVLLSAPMPLL
eukprot:SAG22_NODE_13496_length_404_cov_1.354098_1_plen_114_part_01